MKTRTITIGTRGSKLAMAQAEEVISALRVNHPHTEFQIKQIRTRGDSLKGALPSGPGVKGLFVKEIEEELLRGGCDLAVHSMKDLPTEQPPGLVIAAATRRADPFDALVSPDGVEFYDLKTGACVGTSSPRRAAQLLNVRPDISIVPMRGNLDTRLRKLREGICDAIVVAVAGLQRLRAAGVAIHRLTPPAFVPAPGQGCLAIEIRAGDRKARRIARSINHPQSHAAVAAEKSLLKELGGGCQVPIGAYAEPIGEGRLRLLACVLSPEGRQAVRGEMEGAIKEAVELGAALAHKLIERGANVLLQ
jgi:hydroxymethylbilane synthase